MYFVNYSEGEKLDTTSKEILQTTDLSELANLNKKLQRTFHGKVKPAHFLKWLGWLKFLNYYYNLLKINRLMMLKVICTFIIPPNSAEVNHAVHPSLHSFCILCVSICWLTRPFTCTSPSTQPHPISLSTHPWKMDEWKQMPFYTLN